MTRSSCGEQRFGLSREAIDITHIEILEALAQIYDRPRYLEIGTGDGGCFFRVARQCSVAVTVDVPENPYGQINHHEGVIRGHGCERVEYWGAGSDNFFASVPEEYPGLFNLIFIDGSHWYDQVKRDLENCLEFLAPLGTIAMHDTWSATEAEARDGSDDAYRVAEEIEADSRFQTFTLPVRPGLTLLRPDVPRFQ